MSETDGQLDIGWAIVELMGHRRLAGFVSNGVGPLFRLDIPSEPPATQFYAPAAIYCITPTTEEIAREVATRGQQVAPVSRWELAPPEPPTAIRDSLDDEIDGDADDDDGHPF